MIYYHHIGGRNGTFPLPLKQGPLLQDFQLVLYDADTNCFEQMGKVKQDGWGTVSIYPYCIGGKTGKAPFYINFHPTTNSLYRFNDDYANYGSVSNPYYGEYLLGEACKPLSSINLDLLTLEDALKLADIKSVDYLSLDVQGAEYDIIEGSSKLLASQCVGIQLEAEFSKIYQDQKTFSEINLLMERMGFELIDLEIFGRYSPISLPIGYRGDEQPISSEAIYIRKLSKLQEVGDAEQLYKAAFFALIYKKVGMCLHYLSKAYEINPLSHADKPSPFYKTLLANIWEAYNQDKKYTLPSISQLFSHETFQDFYHTGKSAKTSYSSELNGQINQIIDYISKPSETYVSPLESILNRYGLKEVAQTVKANRQHETNCVLKLAENNI